jgi:hypothetical protein
VPAIEAGELRKAFEDIKYQVLINDEEQWQSTN